MTTTVKSPTESYKAVFPVFEQDRTVAAVPAVADFFKEVDTYLQGVWEDQQAELARLEAARRVPAKAPVSPSNGCAIPANICHRESRGDPQAVNPTGCSGRSCYGKYQFDPRTWDATVRRMGRGDLVGVYLPDEGTQDLVAAFLWDGGRGCSHWAACA